MTPVEHAKALCEARGGCFREELEAHLLTGWVISRPTAFLMGRPMPRSGDPADLWAHWPADECDAWFVWVGIGDAATLLSMMPFALPWVGWHRQGRAWRANHWHSTAALLERFNSRCERFKSALTTGGK